MGVYERDWVEIAEQKVSEALNGNDVNTYYNSIADAISKKIYDLYNQKIKSAVWVGNEAYEDKGDMKVLLESDIVIPVELKFSRKNKSGTKGNASTNLVKKVSKDIINYPSYDENLGLKDKRYALVEEKLGIKVKSKKCYETALREIRNTDKSFLDTISDITSLGQIGYAEYVTEKFNQNIDKLQILIDNILDGNNTTKDVIETENLVYCVIKNFETENQTIEFYDFSDIDSRVVSVVSSGKSIKIRNSSGKDILRFSVLWKNICQGGATPCFNIFVGNAY
jgi:hypothetical protein